MAIARNDNSVQFYLDSGKKHTLAGAFGLAIISFDNAMGAAASSGANAYDLAKISYARGFVRVKQGLYSEAIIAFNEALKGNCEKIKRGYVNYFLGISHFSLNDYKHASIHLDEALGYTFDLVLRRDCVLKLGQAHFRLGNYPKAIAIYIDAMPFSKDLLAQAYLTYGEVLIASHPEAASYNLACAERYLTDHKQKKHCSELLFIAYLESGKQLSKMNKHTEAIQRFSKALEQQNILTEKRDECIHLSIKSSLAQTDGMVNNNAIIVVLEKTIQLAEKYKTTHRKQMAICYYKLASSYRRLLINSNFTSDEFREQAINNYKKAIKTFSKDDLSVEHGLAYISLARTLKKSNSAVKYYNRGILILPDDDAIKYRAYHDCGLLHNDLGNFAEAIGIFEKAIEFFEKSNQFGCAALGHTNTAYAHIALKQHSSVITHCQRAVELWNAEEQAGNPSKTFYGEAKPRLYKSIASSYLMLGEDECSIKANQHAIKLFENFLEKQKAGKAPIKKIIRLKDNIAECYLNVGIAHLRLANKIEAQKNIILAVNYSSETLKSVDDSILQSIFSDLPECYPLIEVYLSQEQRRSVQKFISIRSLHDEPSTSKSHDGPKSIGGNLFKKGFGAGDQGDNYHRLIDEPVKKTSWFSLWKKNKVNPINENSIVVPESPQI
jgi:tetratricopeptide (TPR) repeat protein